MLAPDVPVNALEAFVFGGAVLLHDLANTVAAFPNGLDDLRDSKWDELVHAHYRKRLGRAPRSDEMKNPAPEVSQSVLLDRLREAHAHQAENLATQGFYPRGPSGRATGSGERLHLLDDADLRRTLGPLIGKIAHSHHWDIDRVADEMRLIVPAPPFLPPEWQIDPLKIACLLRIVDAAHIDDRRAPSFSFALRSPSGDSWKHWAFQNKLSRPNPEEGRLVYTSHGPFSIDEADAWWLCFDVLSMIHGELAAVDDALSRAQRTFRFAARSVEGHAAPAVVARRITTAGWTPVDTRIRISDVAGLIERFGGTHLYGDDPYVPLRELLANAADAIRARRALEPGHRRHGRITVRLGKDQKGAWLEVEDNGIGMSKDVLTGPLLDFGTSYWTSWLARQEHPGLYSRGFESTGRFGIGFFSVFMLGDRVTVASRPLPTPGRASADAAVLDFRAGGDTRPMLRNPLEDEWLYEVGTRVRVWLRREPLMPGGILHEMNPTGASVQATLARLLAWIAPTLDVSIGVALGPDDLEPLTAVVADDWTTMPSSALLERLRKPTKHAPLPLPDVDSPTHVFAHGDQRVARLFLSDRRASRAVITVGGFTTRSTVPGFGGVVIGSNPDLSRHRALPLLTPQDLKEWLEDPDVENQLAERVRGLAEGSWFGSLYLSLGIQPSRIPCFLQRDGLSSPNDLEIPSGRRVRLLVDRDVSCSRPDGETEDLRLADICDRNDFELDDDVIGAQDVDMSQPTGDVGQPGDPVSHADDSSARSSLPHLVAKLVAKHWRIDPAVLSRSISGADGELILRLCEIGTYAEQVLFGRVAELVRPEP